MKKQLFMSLVLLCGVSVGYAQKQKGNVPLVYEVENTGSQFAAPKMPTVDALPEIRELPDPLLFVLYPSVSQEVSDADHPI